MLSRLVEILQLLVRLVELDATSRREEKVIELPRTDPHSNSISDAESNPLEGFPSPLALQAPASPTTAVASTPTPKKRGRPPKVNRTEDPRSNPSSPSPQKPYQ